MGYPPPPRRMGDKKRYYYNNRRYGGSYMKNKYNKSFSNSNTHSNNPTYTKDDHSSNISTPTSYVSNNTLLSSTVATALPTSLSSQSLDASPSTAFKSDHQRQSRYNGITSQNPTTSFLKSSTSRYNADSESSTYRTNTVKPRHYPSTSYEEIDSKNSPAGKSRFERSRYPPSSSASSSVSNVASTNGTTTTSPAFTSSRYNASYSTPNSISYQQFPSSSASKYPSSRYRPSPADPALNTTPLLPIDHHANVVSPIVKDEYQRTPSSSDFSLTHNNTAGYPNRSTKWRNTQPVNGSTPSNSSYSIESSTSVKNNFHDKNTDKSAVENIFDTTSPPRSRYNSNVDPLDHTKTNDSKTSKDDSMNNNEKLETVKPPKSESQKGTPTVKLDPSVKTAHPSLIRSVTQTTRKVEIQASIDHKRIDLSKKNNDSSISYESTNDLHSKYSVSKKPSLASLKTANDEIQDRPQLKVMWTSSELSLCDLLKDSSKDEPVMSLSSYPNEAVTYENSSQELSGKEYEYICDSKLLKTPRSNLQASLDTEAPLPEPLEPIEEYIFPMKKTELKLWILKNQARSQIVAKQTYLLKTPIKRINDYPFISYNFKHYISSVRHVLVKSLSQIRKKDVIRRLLIKQKANEMKEKWKQNKTHFHEISAELRKREIEFTKEQEEKNRQKGAEEKITNESNQNIDQFVTGSPGVSSRRRNRADFVDDTEMENILLKIDPEYKHLQAAASIPTLKLNKIDRNVKQFQNVNNLVTDKNLWASRIIFDKHDNFSEHEHSLFIDGYLMFPKKFGRISHHMGGLRTPEECVLHYYKTKKNVNYKELLLDKNKKRKESIAKRRKKKEKDSQHASPTILTNSTFSSDQEAQNVTNEQNVPPATPKPDLQSEELITTLAPEEKKDELVTVVTTVPEQSQNDERESNVSVPNKPVEVFEMSSESTEKADIEKYKPEEKSEKIGDNDVIAIATAAVESIKESPTLEKSDTIEEMGHDTTEIAATMTEHNEHYMENRKRPHDHTILAESSFDMKDDQSVESTAYDLVHADRENLTETGQEDPLKSYGDKSYDGSLKSGDQQGKKKHKYMSEHKTSYWSVREAQIFPELLRMYGSQWSLISENLTTKSTTMVRNYYQRNAAQNGWKTIVDEADFRKDRENPGNSLQQTQFMFQHNTAQPTNNSNTNPIPTINNGIPTQQKPALLFFDKQPNNTASPLVTPTNPQAFSDYNKDVFPNSPVNALPQPRLPSIQFPNSTSTVRNGSNENGYHPIQERSDITKGNPTSFAGAKDLPHLSSSVFDPIRGNVERHDVIGTGEYKITPNLPPMVASTMEPNLGRTIANTFDDNVLQHKDVETTRRGSEATVHSDTRTGSITALLNPMSQQSRHYGSGIVAAASAAASAANESMSRTTLIGAQHQDKAQKPCVAAYAPTPVSQPLHTVPTFIGSDMRSMQPPISKPFNAPAAVAQQQQQVQRQIPDFINDPLAALAAVASAPETLASILPNSGKN